MQIYYFTRTGRSKVVAQQLAERYGVQARPIDDGKDWSGAVGWLKAGRMAATRQALPARYQKPDPGERAAVVFPIWADTFPPAVRTFVNEVGRENLICVPTSLGSKLKDREGFVNIIDLVGKEISAPETLE